MRLTKFHGLGNDYLIVDALRSRNVLRTFDPAVQVPLLCDRRRGVGADGVIIVERGGDESDFTMRIFNSDGSEAEMCGNGIRCVVRLLLERGHTTPGAPLRIRTGAGVLTGEPIRDAQNRCTGAAINMAPPETDPARLPVKLEMFEGEVSPGAELRLEDLPLILIGVGNPHAVYFCSALMDAAEIETLGPRIERHPAFPERMNFHAATIVSRSEVIMRSWERGAGATSACGTGACAVVVAGALSGRLDGDVRVELPGGALNISYDCKAGRLRMTGPAVEVFTIDWEAPAENGRASSARELRASRE